MTGTIYARMEQCMHRRSCGFGYRLGRVTLQTVARRVCLHHQQAIEGYMDSSNWIAAFSLQCWLPRRVENGRRQPSQTVRMHGSNKATPQCKACIQDMFSCYRECKVFAEWRSCRPAARSTLPISITLLRLLRFLLTGEHGRARRLASRANR